MSKHELDLKRREMVELQNTIEQLKMGIAAIITEMTREKKIADELQDPIVFAGLGAYINSRLERIRFLENAIKEWEIKLEAKREEVNHYFQELKRYEITLENKIKQQKMLESKKEDLMLDELALVKYRDEEG